MSSSTGARGSAQAPSKPSDTETSARKENKTVRVRKKMPKPIQFEKDTASGVALMSEELEEVPQDSPEEGLQSRDSIAFDATHKDPLSVAVGGTSLPFVGSQTLSASSGSRSNLDSFEDLFGSSQFGALPLVDNPASPSGPQYRLMEDATTPQSQRTMAKVCYSL